MTTATNIPNLKIENQIEALVAELATDSAHDIDHIRRVVANAKKIACAEDALAEVVIPAAWLHDCVIIPKNSPDRSRASTLAADQAIAWLQDMGYPREHHKKIHHAIVAHSFSTNIPCETIEAKVVQDADRLDALGAIGLARCLAIGGQLSLKLYNADDPFCKNRQPDDRQFTVDHFYQKLLTLPETMQTSSGKLEATKRVKFLEKFIEQLRSEITAE